MKSAKLGCLLLGILALGVSPGRAQQMLDTFTTATSAAVSTQGWQAYVGSTAVDNSTVVNSAGNNPYAAVTNAAGNPNVGFIFTNSGSSNTVITLMKTFAPANALTLNTGTAISWTEGFNTTSSYTELLVQVGGNGTAGSGTWYATVANFKDPNGGITSFSAATTASATREFDYSDTASVWRSVTFTPGSTLTLGAQLSTNLASTLSITGIGFFNVANNAQESMRFDNIQVAAVPEPRSVSFLGLSVLILAVFARRFRAAGEAR